MFGPSHRSIPKSRSSYPAGESADGYWRLRLLGGWSLSRGDEIFQVHRRLQRLIAAVALHVETPRARLAQALWPASTQQRAANSLRVALWEVSHTLPNLLADVRDPVSLHESVSVDLRGLARLIQQIEREEPLAMPVDPGRLQAAELLPDWHDDWVIQEQERLRGLRIEALQRLGAAHLNRGNPGAAMDCAQAATELDPLGDRAHRLLVDSHISSGNYAVAYRTFDDFRDRLRRELDVEPSFRMLDRLEALRALGA